MNEASCRGAWQGALREASHALEIMERTSASAGRAATALVAFEAAAAATIAAGTAEEEETIADASFLVENTLPLPGFFEKHLRSL